MTLRTIGLIWLGILLSAFATSGWWAFAVFTFPPHVLGEFPPNAPVVLPTILCTLVIFLFFIWTIRRLIFDEDDKPKT